jgi:sugar lactone lactonase YvrE
MPAEWKHGEHHLENPRHLWYTPERRMDMRLHVFRLLHERSLRMSELHTLLTGLAFGESPRWYDGRLWVADWGAKEILAVTRDGQREVIVKVSFPSFPLCFDWLPTGQLLLVSSREGRLLRLESGGSLVLHADLSGLAQQGHPWNEIVIDGRGNAYFNNQGFDFPGGQFAPGTIALLTPDGTLRQVADGIAFPNGMAVTPDNSTLIVAESYGNKLTAFDIDASGSLSHRHVWAETGDDHPDGICLDADGALWYADVGNKHCVRVREGGVVLQTAELDRGCFACILGGADGKTLFIVATEWKGAEQMAEGSRTGQILTIRAPAPHAGWP